MKFLKILILSGLLTVSVLGSSHAMGQFFMFENPLVGEKAPEFSLKNLDGKMVDLRSFRHSQNTMVFFWATWCPHCREQLDGLTKGLGQEMQKKEIKILLVDVEESAEEARAYIKKYNVPFDVVLDESGDVSQKYNVVGVPSFFFVDKEGVVRAVEHSLPEKYEEVFNSKK
jgi:peroxiredoxin